MSTVRARAWTRSRVTKLCTIALGLSFLASSGIAVGTAATSAAAKAKPQSGGTLTFAYGLDPGCVDPQQTFLIIGLTIGRSIVDSLTDQNPNTGQIVPWLAKSWTINSNATQYTFTLRPGVTFSNGTPLTAQVVKENFDGIVALGPKAPEASSYLAGYEGTTVDSTLTFTVKFSQPNSQFLQATSTVALGLLAPATLAESPAARCEGTDLIGTGPYLLQSYTPSQQTVLVKRDGYDWAPPLADHNGNAYINKITIAVVPSAEVGEGSLQSGQAQIASVEAPDQPKFVAAGFTILSRPSPGVVPAIEFNQRNPIVADKAVRVAFSEALNRKALGVLYSASGTPANSILAPDSPGYANLSSLLKYDPKAAEATLNKDGWKVGPGGIRVKDGKQLIINQINFVDDSTFALQQQEEKAVGIDFEAQVLSIGQYDSLLASGNFESAQFNEPRADPDILREVYSSSGVNNMGLPSGSPMDSIFTQMQATVNSVQRDKLAVKAEKLILENADSAPLAPLTLVYGVSNTVHGLTFDASSLLFFYNAWRS